MTVVRDTTTARDVSTGDAAFQAWVTMIHNAITGVGLVDTADTGAINPATVTAPAGGSFAGFIMYRFPTADSGQSADPIYMKVEYGRSTTTSRGTLRFSFGTGTDGAGTLANASSTNVVTNATPSGTPELHVCYVNGSFILWESAAQTNFQAIGVMVERARDASGNVITSGLGKAWLVLTAIGVTGSSVTWERRQGQWHTTNSAGWTGAPSAADPDGRIRIPLKCVNDHNPLITICYPLGTQVASGDSGPLSVYGTTRTYKVMTMGTGTSLGASGNDIGGTSNNSAVKYAVLNE